MTTWVKVYNSMPAHPKFLQVGVQGGWLFVCGLCYCNEHLTDGYVSRRAVAALAPGLRQIEKVAASLVDAGLWHEAEGGWRIHDYVEHQRNADEIRDRRERDRQRKAGVRNSSTPSPRGQVAESAPIPQRVRGVDVESREQKAEIEPASQAAPKRVSRRVDQSQLPEGFPDELVATVGVVQPILIRCWDARGGIEPGHRGVGLAVLRNPRADHERIARRLEHWLLAGKGQRARCADIASRFGDWVEGEGAALTVVDGGSRAAAVQRANAWQAGYGEAG